MDLDHLSIWIIITGSGSSLDLDHHRWIWIISRSRSSSNIITGSGSSLDQDHHCWIIITGSRSSLDLDHPWCYLMILLVTGSSTELALFHASCRPSLLVGLLQHLYLTLSQNGQHSHLTMRGIHPTSCQKGIALTFTSMIGHNYYHL